MIYEWDENKRAANLEKHGLDFDDARFVYESPDKLTLPCKTFSENRLLDIAKVEGLLVILSLVYVMRSKTVRVISLRFASRKERNIFYGKDR